MKSIIIIIIDKIYWDLSQWNSNYADYVRTGGKLKAPSRRNG